LTESHHRVITKEELKHFTFIFDKMDAWKKSVNDESERIGIMYNNDVISFKKFWNDTVGKDLNELKKYLSENWLIEDEQIGLMDIKDYIRWNKL